MKNRHRLLLIASLPLAIAVIIGVLAMLPPQPGVTKADLDRIKEGMDPVEVDAILEMCTRQSGNMHWGGSGAFRRVYQVGNSDQIWVEIGGSYHGQLFGRVVQVGTIEPFQEWTVRRDEMIREQSFADKMRRWLHLR